MKKLSLIILSLFSFSVLADENEKIIQALKPFNLHNMEIVNSPIKGIKTVLSSEGIFYATVDGQYFLQGSLVQLTDKGSVDLTAQYLRKQLDKEVSKAISFKAENEKFVVDVFTDQTCPFCVKLHREIPEYNKRGITVRYFAFPRAGAKSKAAREMEAIWKAQNPQQAFTDAVNGKKTAAAQSTDLVEKQYSLGHQFGVNGTPAWVLSNGQLLPGYLSPDDLLAFLSISK